MRRYLRDVNIDWGQQLKTVKQYLDVNHSPDCWLPISQMVPYSLGITASGVTAPPSQAACGGSTFRW